MSKPDSLIFDQVPVGAYRNFSYIVGDSASLNAAVVDPAWEIESLISRIREKNLHLNFIINTHAHFDHIQGNMEMKRRTGAKIVMSSSSLAMKDLGVGDGEVISLGEEVHLGFIHTPGHSPESMCIKVNDYALITGDTLFIGECGRTDLPGGDPSALYDSFEKLRQLKPSSLVVFPGHDYGKSHSATLSDEIRTNYTLATMSREDFVKFMSTP